MYMRFVFGSTTMSAGQIRLGRAVDAAVGVVAVRALRACRADLVDERAVRLELQDLRIVAEVRRPRILPVKVRACPLPGDIDEVVVIDVDAVLARRPEAAVLPRGTSSRGNPGSPGPPHACSRFPALVELEHRRRRDAAAVDAGRSGRGCPSALIGLPFASLPAAPCCRYPWSRASAGGGRPRCGRACRRRSRRRRR